MKLSKSGYRILNQRYRSVLRKCFLINAGLFFLSTPVMATDIEINGTNVSGTNKITLSNGSLRLENNSIYLGTSGTIDVQEADLAISNSSIDLSGDDGLGYIARANFTNSSVSINDSEFIVDGDLSFIGNQEKNATLNITYTDKENYSEIEAYNLTLNSADMTINDTTYKGETTVAAKKNLSIIGGSNVTLNNNAILAWNGQVYQEDENGKDVVIPTNGTVEIKQSSVTLNDTSKLLIGAPDDEGADNNQATLKMDNATINLNDSSSVEFYAKNNGQTNVHKSIVTLTNDSSMILNDIKLTGNSKIYVMDNASLSLDSVVSQGGTIITGGTSSKQSPMIFRNVRPFSNDEQTKIEINIKNTEWINAKDNDDDVIEAFEFENANVTITESDIETEGNLFISNSNLNISCINCYDTTPGNEDYSKMVMGENVTISKSNVVLGDSSRLGEGDKEDAYLGANDKFNILNSNVTVNGNSLLAYEGTVEDGNGVGEVNITNSTIRINDNGKILLGTPEDDSDIINGQTTIREAYATLNISNSTIKLTGNAQIEFDANNPEATTITDSQIDLVGSSKMTLNDVTLKTVNEENKTTLSMKGNSTVIANNVSIENAIIDMRGDSFLDVWDVSMENVKIKGSADIRIRKNEETSSQSKNSDTIALTLNGMDIETDIISDNKNNKVKFTGNNKFTGFFDPATADVEGSLTRGGYDDEITYNINTNGTLKYASDSYLYDATKHTHNIGETRQEDNTFIDGQYALNSINFNGGVLDLRNNKVSEIKLSALTLSNESNLYVDTDLQNKKMDTLKADTITANAKLNIAGLNLISDATQKETVINFTSDSDLLSKVEYTGQTSGLTALSPVYTYDVSYDNANGNFTFTRGGGESVSDYNPAVYSATTTAQTVGFLQQNIAGEVFNQLSNQVTKPMGISSGDEPYSNNAWVSVIGSDDKVEFDTFETIDAEMMSVAGGFTSDKNYIGKTEANFGVYAGYLSGESKYTGNEIDQEGAYIGLGSLLRNGNFTFANAINTGFINNKAKHSFGTDKYDTYWAGLSLKGGYDYHICNTLTVQPFVYAGYTFVDTEDYTSKSGAKIKNDSLNLFEIAPGLKINKDFSNGWNGFAQVRYTFVMDDGGNTNIDSAVLPNISAKDYVEYGIGIDKDINSAWSLSADVNRRDGGREGWNGSLTIKYNF
ncbi:MAG: autotransporter domain-containing protein [Alphaproteobacteria bacterium]|nr:autotransporter domain-containing protein [Alphaproteobacteria bacterium]